MASIISYPSIDGVRKIYWVVLIWRCSWSLVGSSERKVDPCEGSGLQNDTLPDWQLTLAASWELSHTVWLQIIWAWWVGFRRKSLSVTNLLEDSHQVCKVYYNIVSEITNQYFCHIWLEESGKPESKGGEINSTSVVNGNWARSKGAGGL